MPVWLDLVAAPDEWAVSFLAPEAKEVLDALGGVVVVFALAEGGGAKARAKELVAHVGRVVREGLGGWEWDGVLLAIGVGTGRKHEAVGSEDEEVVIDEWEDVCAEWGLEFVHVHDGDGNSDGDGSGDRNEFGERMGIPRALEALQANDWSAAGRVGDGAEDDDGDDDEFGPLKTAGEDEEGESNAEFDPESMGFGFDRADFVGLRKAIWAAGRTDGGGEGDGDGDGDEEIGDEDVQVMERMMVKLQAVRDRSAGMPEEQRRRMAKQAVDEVMKEI